MNKELIQRTEAFLKEKLDGGAYLNAHPEAKAYRLEHSYRVANIGREIARREGFDETEAVIAGLARVRIVPGTRQAELAIVLARHVMGLGLGRHLLQKLVKWARTHRLERVYGDIPAGNQPMLDLAASMGFSPEPGAEGVPAGLVRQVLELSGH